MTKEGILAKPILGKEVMPNVQQSFETGGDIEKLHELEKSDRIITPEEEKARVENIADTVSTEADSWAEYAKEETAGSIPEEGLFDWLLKSKVGNAAKALMLSTALAGAMSFLPASSAEAGDRRYGRNQRQAEESYRQRQRQAEENSRYRQDIRYLEHKINMIGYGIKQRARMEVNQTEMALMNCGRMIQMIAYQIENIKRGYSYNISRAEHKGDASKVKELKDKMNDEIAPRIEQMHSLQEQYKQLEKELRKDSIKSIFTNIGVDVISGR